MGYGGRGRTCLAGRVNQRSTTWAPDRDALPRCFDDSQIGRQRQTAREGGAFSWATQSNRVADSRGTQDERSNLLTPDMLVNDS